MKKMLIFIIVCFSLHASSVIPDRYSLFSVNDSSLKKIDLINKKFEIVERRKRNFIFYVLKHDLEKFKKLAPMSKKIEDVDAKVLFGDHREEKLRKGYRSYQEVLETIKLLSKNISNLVSLENYGKSSNGNDLIALKMTNPNSEEKVKILLTAATHGDELITTEALLRFIETIVASKDPRIQSIFNKVTLYVIPVVNPDGFKKRSRYAHRWTDPNRNFPYPERKSHKPIPIIQALTDFYLKHKFSASIDFHAYGKMIMYPWGYTKERPEVDMENKFKNIVENMSKESLYQTGQISHILYTAKGNSADYFFWKTNSISIGIELAQRKVPIQSKIPKIVKNLESMTLNFIEAFIR